MDTLEKVARLIHDGITITRLIQAQIEEGTMQTHDEFHNSPEVIAFTKRIHNTIIEGMDEARNRTYLSLFDASRLKEHLRHGSVHMLNVMHHDNMRKLDNEGGNEFDHAVTRFFAAACIDDKMQKEAMKGLQEEIAE